MPIDTSSPPPKGAKPVEEEIMEPKPSPTKTEGSDETSSFEDTAPTNASSSLGLLRNPRDARRFRRLFIFLVLGVLVLFAILLAIGLTGGDENPDGSKNRVFSFRSVQTPTEQPTAMPSSQPTTSPSDSPTISPSAVPTARPSLRPSASPTTSPSNAPTSAPTREPIPDGYNFRLKLYWEREFLWQEEDVERRWCLECTTCNQLTTSDFGEGCRDSDSSNGNDCQSGDQLWTQNCNGWANGSGNTRFEIVRHENADQLKIRDKNLCLERLSSSWRILYFKGCDASEERQLFVGFKMDEPFALQPYRMGRDGIERCFTQHHHPKMHEIIFLEECEKAWTWDTALWEALE